MPVQLSFFVSSPFAVEAAEIYCRPGKNWYSTTRLRIELNGATLSDRDLCDPALLDSAGQRGMPRLVEQQVMHHLQFLQEAQLYLDFHLPQQLFLLEVVF